MTHTVGMGCSCTNYGHTAYTIHVHAYLSWHCMYVYMCIHIYIYVHMSCFAAWRVPSRIRVDIFCLNAWVYGKKMGDLVPLLQSLIKQIGRYKRDHIYWGLPYTWLEEDNMNRCFYVHFLMCSWLHVCSRCRFRNADSVFQRVPIPSHIIHREAVSQEGSDIATLELWSLASPWTETRQFARLEAGKVMVP